MNRFQFRKLVRQRLVEIGPMELCPLGAAMWAWTGVRDVGHPGALRAAEVLGLDGEYCMGVARGWDTTRQGRREGLALVGWRYGRRLKRLSWGRRIGVRKDRTGK